MNEIGKRNAAYGIDKAGIRNPGKVHYNLGPAELAEEAVRRGDLGLARFGQDNRHRHLPLA